jgi:hypothetical protein
MAVLVVLLGRHGARFVVVTVRLSARSQTPSNGLLAHEGASEVMREDELLVLPRPLVVRYRVLLPKRLPADLVPHQATFALL